SALLRDADIRCKRPAALGHARRLLLIHAVVLAAGASSRYGAAPPKQQELLPDVLAALHKSSALDGILVVLGAHPVETDEATVQCPDWEEGPGASLRCGLRATRRWSCSPPGPTSIRAPSTGSSSPGALREATSSRPPTTASA